MRWSLLCVLVVGCALEEPDVTVTAAPLNCNLADPLSCPGNTSQYVGPAFDRFDDTRLADSPRGYRIVKVTHMGIDVPTFTAVGAKVHAVRKDNVLLDGPNAVGIVIRVHHDSGKEYDLSLLTYIWVPFYSGGTPEIVGYYITYREIGSREVHDLCHYKDYYDDGLEGTWAVFSKGDLIDPKSGVITATNLGVGSWVSVGCAGDSTIKAARARAAGSVAWTTTKAQRQTFINFITASYCGPGTSFTQLGTPITWEQAFGSHELGDIDSIEAVWNETGALCLKTPRYESPDLCAPPMCTNDMVTNWDKYGWILSANPPPPP